MLGIKALKIKLLLAVTLVEVIVTMAIIAILAGLTMAGMKTIKQPQELVDQATDMVENLLNQANANSITLNKTFKVCSLNKAAASGFATCSATSSSWVNVNGHIFNKVGVTISRNPVSEQEAENNIITYDFGLVSGSYTIYITSTSKPACSNIITVWPNGVLEIDYGTTSPSCMT